MVRLEVKNLNKTFTVHTRGGIEVKGFENINLSRKYVENIAKIIEFIRLFFYNKGEIINVYIYT